MSVETKKQNWFRKHWIISIFLGLFVIGVINGFFSNNDSNITGNVVNEEISNPPQEEVKTCVPDWSCSSWLACESSGTQKRTCVDSNNCGTNEGKLSETQKCDYQFKLGDRVVVDEVAYVVHSRTESNKVGKSYSYGDYESFMGETADGIFYIFDITIENVGKESRTFWGSNIKIYDNQGRSFDHDTTAEIYTDDSFSYDQLQPGLPKRGKIV